MDLLTVSLFAQAGLYVFAGVMHFVSPKFYVNIMPKWMPLKKESVFWSGVVEVVLGCGLLSESLRSMSAMLIVAMLLGPFMIVHVNMLVRASDYPKVSHNFLVIRVVAQFFLIAWAYSFV
eukprot:Amastigsp_a345709_57.p4 type:complete len:120 gc:universal Amastigsp_a345709_57:412-53(-)